MIEEWNLKNNENVKVDGWSNEMLMNYIREKV